MLQFCKRYRRTWHNSSDGFLHACQQPRGYGSMHMSSFYKSFSAIFCYLKDMSLYVWPHNPWCLICFGWCIAVHCNFFEFGSKIVVNVTFLELKEPISRFSQSSIPLYPVSSPGQFDLYPGGHSLMKTNPWVPLLTVTFIIRNGHPDIGSWQYIKCLGSRKG